MDVGGGAIAELEVCRGEVDEVQKRIARLAERYVLRFDDDADEETPAEASAVPPPPAWRGAKSRKRDPQTPTRYSIPNLRARARVWRDVTTTDRSRPLAERLRRLGGFPKK